MKIINPILNLALFTSLLTASAPPSFAAADFTQTLIINSMMRFLDTNKNQQIEITEIETRWKQAFDLTDKNANDVLTLDEFDALFKARSTQIKLLDPGSKLPSIKIAFKALDLNSNNIITRWEFNTHAINQFRLVDTDENNALSQAEMLAVKGRLPF